MNGFPRLIAAAAIAISACPPAADAVDGPARTQTAQAPTGRSTPRAPAAAPAAAQPAVPAAPAPAAQPTGGQPASAPAPPPIPTRTEILNFENWVVTCNEFAEGPKTRACSALLQIVQQNTNQIVFAWTIGFDNAKQIVTVMQTPTGVNIPPGIELRVGKVPPHKIPFASCDAGRCVATSPMDATLLREMTTVPTAEAIVQGSQGNTVQFTIQMKGFDKAFAALSRS
jgi:invasion protein IalB